MTFGSLRTSSGVPSAILRPKFKTEMPSHMCMHAGEHVLNDRHLAEHADVLERARQPTLRTLPARPSVDRLSVEADMTFALMAEAGDQVECSRLARTVRPD